MIRIIQQRNKCIGCNACVEAINTRWRMSRKDGKSVLIGAIKKGMYYSVVVDDDEFIKNKRAETNCPVKIIQLIKI